MPTELKTILNELLIAEENELEDIELLKRQNLARQKMIRDALVLLDIPPVVVPTPLPEPVEPPEPEIEPPAIYDILVSEDRKLVTVLWGGDGPVHVSTFNDQGLRADGEDVESPLNIAVGSGLAQGFTVVNGAFEGKIVVVLTNDGGIAEDERFVAPTKPTTPEIPTKPVEPTPGAKPLSSFKNYQKGQVKAQGTVKVLGKIAGVRRAAHPSLRNTQEGLIVLDDASKVFRIADLIAKPETAKPIGQFNTGGGADKAEFSPFDTGYYYLKNSVLYYAKLGENPEVILGKSQVEGYLGFSVEKVISGPSELGLISDDGLFGAAALKDGYYHVFAYDVKAKKFIGKGYRVKLNDSRADYIGTFGTRSVVLKNVKQGGENWKYKYDLWYFDIDGTVYYRHADKEGMYHAAGTVFSGANDMLVDINKRWNTEDHTFEVAQPLIEGLGGHVGRLDNVDGSVTMSCNQTGNMIATDSTGGIYCGNGVGKNDCYSVAFEFNGKLYAVVTKAIGDVELREVS